MHQRANRNALFAGLIWGMIFSSSAGVLLRYLPYGVWNILWYGGNFMALIAYPIVSSILLRSKTGLWINTCFFSLWGGGLCSWGSALIRSFQAQDWANLGINIALLLFVAWKLFPFIQKNYALESEYDSPYWQQINEFSWVDFLFCRFDLGENPAPPQAK